MAGNKQEQSNNKATPKQQTPLPQSQNFENLTSNMQLDATVQRAKLDPRTLSSRDVQQLQRMIGNRSVNQLLKQPKQSANLASPFLTIQKQADGNSVDPVIQQITSQTIQRDPDYRAMLHDDMQDDLQTNITAFNTGMNSAAILFRDQVRAEIAGMSTEDKSKLWVKFGLAVAGLAMPVLAPIVGLSAGGIALILGTVNLTMDDAINQETDNTSQLRLQESAILNYFIGTTNSVQSNLDGIDREQAAESFLQRVEQRVCPDFSQDRVRDNQREDLQQTLFDSSLLRGRNVLVNQVNRHMLQQMMRMWHLTTVADQADKARTDECFMGHCAGDSVTAFVEKTIELFPDFLTQMRQHMPSRYRYWIEEKDGTMNVFEVLRFRNDIRILGDIVRSSEFGTEREIHWSEGPSVWAN